MKKTTKTTPASKTTVVPTTKTTVASAIKTALAPVTKSIKAPVKKSAPVKKKPAGTTAAIATIISAKVDLGFGNHLYLRGEGPGLSWDKGQAMDCSSNLLWSTNLTGATAPVVFKVLVNDLTWSTGKDYVVEPGQSVTITPTF